MNKTGSLAIFVVSVIVLAADPVQAEMRTWTDSSGAYKVEAELVDENDGTVRLKRGDGRIVSLPLDRLSPADQAYVRNQRGITSLPPY